MMLFYFAVVFVVYIQLFNFFMQCLIQTDVSISDFNRAWQYLRFFFSYETAMR